MIPSPSDERDERNQQRVAALLAELDRLAGSRCSACSRSLCNHQVLVCVAMGLEEAPRCLMCIAQRLERSVEEMRADVADYLRHRVCYREVWDMACDREGQPRSAQPPCLETPAHTTQEFAEHARPAHEPGGERPADAQWDAGELACGDLVLALRGRMAALPAGAILHLIARDPAAPEDLPSWCRLTGHRLVGANHPNYFIRRKEN